MEEPKGFQVGYQFKRLPTGATHTVCPSEDIQGVFKIDSSNRSVSVVLGRRVGRDAYQMSGFTVAIDLFNEAVAKAKQVQEANFLDVTRGAVEAFLFLRYMPSRYKVVECLRLWKVHLLLFFRQVLRILHRELDRWEPFLVLLPFEGGIVGFSDKHWRLPNGTRQVLYVLADDLLSFHLCEDLGNVGVFRRKQESKMEGHTQAEAP